MSALKKAMKQQSTTETAQKSCGCSSALTMTKHHNEPAATPYRTAEVPSKQKEMKSTKTKIVAHIDCGFTNNLFIRGEGISSLSWDKGTQMKNVGPNEWVWESDRPFSTVQFKVLVNDSWFEQGNNHSIAFGQNVEFSPQF
jgi:hypothetical protein